MRLFFSLVILTFFVQCTEDDTPLVLNRNYLVGNWQLDRGGLFADNLIFELEDDNTFAITADGGVTVSSGVWSYNEQDRELLMQSADGLEIYEVLNFSDNRLEALITQNEWIVFFTRLP